MVAEAQSSYRRAWDHCLVKYSSQKTTVIEASHGNAGVWKAWKAKKPAFHPSHTPWKSLRGFPHYHGYGDDYHVSEDRQSPPKTRNQSHSRRKGLVNHVPGPKRKGCPGTLTPLRGFCCCLALQEKGPALRAGTRLLRNLKLGPGSSGGVEAEEVAAQVGTLGDDGVDRAGKTNVEIELGCSLHLFGNIEGRNRGRGE